jgi:hypothetical protein
MCPVTSVPCSVCQLFWLCQPGGQGSPPLQTALTLSAHMVCASAASLCCCAAQSPGKLKDQQTYLLGHAGDADLCRAVLSLFMDPQQAVDPEAAYSSGKAMLAMANGYRTSQHELDLERAVAVSSSQLKPGGRGAVWRLPAVGAAPADEPLVQNVRLQLVMNQVRGGVGSSSCARGVGVGSSSCAQAPLDALHACSHKYT